MVWSYIEKMFFNEEFIYSTTPRKLRRRYITPQKKEKQLRRIKNTNQKEQIRNMKE